MQHGRLFIRISVRHQQPPSSQILHSPLELRPLWMGLRPPSPKQRWKGLSQSCPMARPQGVRCNVSTKVPAAIGDKAPLYKVYTSIYHSRLTKPLLSSCILHAGWPAELLRHAAYRVTMGARSRSGCLLPFLPAFSMLASARGGCQLASALLWSRQYTKRVPQVILPTIGPLQLGSRCTGYTPSSSMTGWWPGLRSMACSGSPVQAGFRPRQSPVHHLFALRHFIDRAMLQQRPLFVAFVDLQKAYDTVQHGLLLAYQSLQNRSIAAV